MLLFNVAGHPRRLRDPAAAGVPPAQPAGLGAPSPDLSWNTAVSFVTNTNWQSYGGETTLSYFTQMLALAVQNFVCAASGMAVLVALIRGIHAQDGADASATSGSISSAARSTSCCRSRSSVALVLVSQGVVQTFHAYQTVPLLQATKDADGKAVDRSDPRRSARPPRRSRSRCSAPTAAASSTRTRRTRSRTRPPLSNFVEMLVAPRRSPRRSAYTFGKMVKDTRQGWALFAAMSAILLPLLVALRRRGAGGQPRASSGSPSTRRRARLQSGGNMEGKEVRFGIANSGLFATITTAVSCGARQRDARLVHAARRPRADVAHPARRGHLRRRRRGPVRDAHVRRRRRLRRRADGRADARVPRQEDRGVRDEDGVARRPRPAGDGPHHDGDRRRRPRRGSKGVFNPGPHGFSEILYAFSSAANNNGSAFGGLIGEHALLQHDSSASRCSSAASSSRFRVLALAGLAREEEDRPDDAPARCPRTRRSSSRCSSASSSSSARSRSSPRSRSGPIVEQLLAQS